MPEYSDLAAYPKKITPLMTDTRLGTDREDNAFPCVTVELGDEYDAASAADKNLQSAARSSGNGVDWIGSQSGGVLAFYGPESSGGALTVARNVTRETVDINPVFGTNAGEVAEGDAPAAAAAGVQTNLDTHTGTVTGNPHGVTAADAGADVAGSAATVQTNLDTHTGTVTGNPHEVTAAEVGADVAGSAATVQTNLNTHTGDAAIHRSFTVDESAAITVGLSSPSASNVFATIADLPSVDVSADYTWTGTHTFDNPIMISDGGTNVASIGIDAANTALRIELPSGSGVTQVLINKIGGDADIVTDGELTVKSTTLPGDS